MTRLLDARTSQNASIANSISIPITILSQPGLFGQIGLNVSGATGPIRTQLSGTVTCQYPSTCSNNYYSYDSQRDFPY